ncbi:17602_t:CDS:1, partial [Racocetra persica]
DLGEEDVFRKKGMIEIEDLESFIEIRDLENLVGVRGFVETKNFVIVQSLIKIKILLESLLN